MRRYRTPQRDDRGVVAIEFVFILPFLLMIIMGFLVLGNYLSVKGQASNLARDGARIAVLFPGTPLGDARLSLDSPPCPTSPRDPTKSVTVKATLDIELNSIPLIPLSESLIGNEVSQEVTMRCGG